MPSIYQVPNGYRDSIASAQALWRQRVAYESYNAAMKAHRACAKVLYVTAGRSESKRDPWTNGPLGNFTHSSFP